VGGNVKTFLTVIISVMLVALPSCKKEENALPIEGNKATSFTLKDTDGKSVRLSDLSGRAAVMEFWATWCGPCKESSVELEKLYWKYKDRAGVYTPALIL
jgi:thiol-disulfide isomerase/thioredoxin